MTPSPEPAIRVGVDPTNPGQYFACCGLLELADRFWDGAEGWFSNEGDHFFVRPISASADLGGADFFETLASCPLSNTMTESQLRRRDELSRMPKKDIKKDPSIEAEKKALDTLWREAPLRLREPFNLCLDWFQDERAGGDAFKTWAGQQSVFEIARGMKALAETALKSMLPEDWLRHRMNSDSVPFNFDADLGGMGSDRDVGFSLDPLKTIKVQTRPFLEFFSFVGLQRFRPLRIARENRYRFSLWPDPLVPEVASIAACGLLQSSVSRAYEFRLLYRTKYLKSFLPANPVRGGEQ